MNKALRKDHINIYIFFYLFFFLYKLFLGIPLYIENLRIVMSAVKYAVNFGGTILPVNTCQIVMVTCQIFMWIFYLFVCKKINLTNMFSPS